VIIEPDFQALLAANGLTSLDALFRAQGSKRFDKPGLPDWRERLKLEVTDADGHARTIFLKRYTRPPASVQVRRWLAGSIRRGTAWTEWRWLHELGGTEDRAARPVAFAQDLRGPWEYRSALLMAAVPGDALERWVIDHPGPAPRDLLRALARFMARFHADGFVHRDLYLSHVFYDDAEAGQPRFRLIDLQRVFRPRWRRGRWIVKDLAALNYSTPSSVASITDRLRWLRVYLGVPKLRGRDRRLIRQIAAKTRQIADHDRRRQTRHGPATGGDRRETGQVRLGR
jgi:heptose I phosphotransferase